MKKRKIDSVATSSNPVTPSKKISPEEKANFLEIKRILGTAAFNKQWLKLDCELCGRYIHFTDFPLKPHRELERANKTLDSILHQAVLTGNLELVTKTLMSHKVRIDSFNCHQVLRGDYALTSFHKFLYKGTALCWAVQAGLLQIVNYLLDNGADITGAMNGEKNLLFHSSEDEKIYDTPLLYAIRGNDRAIINALFNRKRDILPTTLIQCVICVHEAVKCRAMDSLLVLFEKIIEAKNEELLLQYATIIHSLGIDALLPILKMNTPKVTSILNQLLNSKSFLEEFFIQWCSPQFINDSLANSISTGNIQNWRSRNGGTFFHKAAIYRRDKALIDVLIAQISKLMFTERSIDSVQAYQLAADCGNLIVLHRLLSQLSVSYPTFRGLDLAEASCRDNVHILRYIKENHPSIWQTANDSPIKPLIKFAITYNALKILNWYAQEDPRVFQWQSKTKENLLHIAATQSYRASAPCIATLDSIITPDSKVIELLAKLIPDGFNQEDSESHTPAEIAHREDNDIFEAFMLALQIPLPEILDFSSSDLKAEELLIDGIKRFLSTYLMMLYSRYSRSRSLPLAVVKVIFEFEPEFEYKYEYKYSSELKYMYKSNSIAHILKLAMHSSEKIQQALFLRAIPVLFIRPSELKISPANFTVYIEIREAAKEIVRLAFCLIVPGKSKFFPKNLSDEAEHEVCWRMGIQFQLKGQKHWIAPDLNQCRIEAAITYSTWNYQFFKKILPPEKKEILRNKLTKIQGKKDEQKKSALLK